MQTVMLLQLAGEEVGGTLVDALVLRSLAPSAPLDDARRRILAVVRGWGRVATTPAMLLVWAAGIALALTGRWFGQSWLTEKLVAVVALSGIHGAQWGRLRRLASANGVNGGGLVSPALIIALAAGAIVLVVIKPGQ